MENTKSAVLNGSAIKTSSPVFASRVKRKRTVPEKLFFDIELPLGLKEFYLKKKPPSFLKNLKYGIFSDIDECFALWEEFSPKDSLFDLWDFRLAFYQAYQYPLHFILLKKGVKNIGLLPLWYESGRQKYYWFGGWWPEDNKFFLKDPIFTPILLNLCPKPVYLSSLSPSVLTHLVANEEFKKFTADDPKYILDLSGIKSFEDYLMKLKKSRRHSIRKGRKKIEKQNPEIIINNFADFEDLVALCLKRFQHKVACGYVDDEIDDAGWEDKRRVESFRNFIKMSGKNYDARIITVKINGRIAGVDLIAVYNNCYYALACGYDVKNFPGIGNYLNILDIEEAIQMGVRKIDFLQNSYQWKDKWFQPVSLLKYLC
jgi:hypothetical protein